ncbi:MAG: CPBP family intramembrane metalloprotease [Opitutaceae bacterium]|jgi:membrane protease YdiL (CAAX protease family)|nr:CPBP family intramembrane metalloprotease [Opitutaceae bacterium]
MDFALDEPVLLAVNLLEVLLLITGCLTLYRWYLGSRSQLLKPIRLAAWTISLGDFLTRALFALLGGLSLQFLAQSLEHRFRGSLNADIWLVIYNLAFQLGLLGGVGLGVFYSRARGKSQTSSPSPIQDESPSQAAAPFQAPAFLSGLMTFLAALPLVALSAWLWTTLLHAAGVNTRQQELVDMLTRTDSPLLVSIMTALAIVFAPIVEELVFRAGVFRYLRSRLPGIPAYLVSAIFFSALHANSAAFVPLVVFGIVLAFVYERTGRLSICIFAHATFNLHTLAILLVSLKEQTAAAPLQ